MAKEAEENAENTEGGEEAALPMFSKTGKIVYAATCLILLGGFAAFLIFANKPPMAPEVLQEEIATKNVKDLNAPRIEITKPIIMSIPTSELATEFRHLAVTLTIIIGRLPDENDESFDLMKALAAEQFLETAEKFEPWVKDSVNDIALGYSYLQLQQKTTKTDLTAKLKASLNNKLEEYGMKPRISEILLTSFIFSD